MEKNNDIDGKMTQRCASAPAQADQGRLTAESHAPDLTQRHPADGVVQQITDLQACIKRTCSMNPSCTRLTLVL
eukprot:332986-Pelagomonas_calceolata.AAC.4